MAEGASPWGPDVIHRVIEVPSREVQIPRELRTLLGGEGENAEQAVRVSLSADILKRTITLRGPITMEVAEQVTDMLTTLADPGPMNMAKMKSQVPGFDAAEWNRQPITFKIYSPGGDVRAGLEIIDVMQQIQRDAAHPVKIATVCTGLAASMAALLLIAGTKGLRTAYPHSRILFHQLSAGGIGGNADEIGRINEWLQTQQADLDELVSEHTGLSREEAHALMHSGDTILSARQAVAKGVVDVVPFVTGPQRAAKAPEAPTPARRPAVPDAGELAAA